MTARFAAPLRPGGRHCLLSGSLTVGAVFPPAGPDDRWHWRLWVLPEIPRTGRARTEAAAKAALLLRWEAFLEDAALKEAR